MYLYLLLVTIGLLSGTLLTWPLWPLWVGLAVSLLALWHCPFWRTRSQPLLWLLCWLAGASWSSLWLEERLAQRLPAAQDRSLASLQLELLSAEQRGQVWRLQARVLTPAATLQQQGLPPLQQLQLNWYRTPHTLQAGQRWQADVLLRSPRNFLNNLPFDYEAFLLSRGVDATGYIRAAHLLDKEARPPGMRQRWLSWQQQHVDADAWPWVAGLVFGEQAAFSAGQWQLAQRTGTLHLLVVSGLHVGLMVLLALGVWWLLARLPLLKSGQGIYAVTLPGLLLVVGISAAYVWLAGAGIALQRAWVMLLVLLCLQYSRWRLRWPLALLHAVVVERESGGEGHVTGVQTCALPICAPAFIEEWAGYLRGSPAGAAAGGGNKRRLCVAGRGGYCVAAGLGNAVGAALPAIQPLAPALATGLVTGGGG